MLGLGCPNPRVAPHLGLGLGLGLRLVPTQLKLGLRVALSQLRFRVMLVPTLIGILRGYPNLFWDSLGPSQLTLGLPLIWDCLGAPHAGGVYYLHHLEKFH